MDNTFVQVNPDTYSIDYMDVTILVSVKPDTIIELEMPPDQFNPNRTSCLWYYKRKLDGFPHRCILAANITDNYHL